VADSTDEGSKGGKASPTIQEQISKGAAMIIHLVTAMCGEHSNWDYQIIGAYDTREDAEEHRTILNAEKARHHAESEVENFGPPSYQWEFFVEPLDTNSDSGMDEFIKDELTGWWNE
jgi:hypothetical protein